MRTGDDAAADAGIVDDAAVPPTRRPRRRALRVTAASIAAAAVIVALVASLTPWPSAMLVRTLFESGGGATVEEMSSHVPDMPLAVSLDVPAGDDPASTMDVFAPEDADGPLPTVVWIHGGAWISGSKDDVAPYLRMIAAEGYTAIGLDYPRGPEDRYPAAVEHINAALADIVADADALGVDPSRIVLAGDSAGAQLASQVAALATNPDYAELLSIAPALSGDQIAATVLNCGVYDVPALAEVGGSFGWSLKASLWAYTGTRDRAASAAAATMSTIDWATADFPATYISGGNADDLTWTQSIPFAHRLEERGVETTTLFWPAAQQPALGHEYQFHLDEPAARTAFRETIAFLDRHTAR